MRWTILLAALLLAALLVLRLLAPPDAESGAGSGARPDDPGARPAPAPAGGADAAAPRRTELAPDAAGIRVAGRVVNLAYAGLESSTGPAAGVGVRAQLRSSRFGGETLAEADLRTTAAGRYEILWPDPGMRPLYWTVWAEEDDLYRAAAAQGTLVESEPAALEVELQRPAHGTLQGDVVDSDATPLAGALVRFAYSWTEIDVVEATTGTDGRFRFEHFRHPVSRSAALAGYTQLATENPVRLADGGWKPYRIGMAAAGRIRLRVLGSRDAPLPDVHVTADLAPAEREARTAFRFDQRPYIAATTDSEGLALLEGVWARRKLVLALSDSERVWLSTRHSTRELVFGDPSGAAEPLVIGASGELDLVARLPAGFRIEGHVRFADGSAAPQASVEVREVGGYEDQTPGFRAGVRADEDGRFVIPVRAPHPPGLLRVAAGDQHLEGFLGPAPFEQVAMTVVDPASARDGRVWVELTLEPTYSISGTVRTEDGRTVEGRLLARAVDAEGGPLAFLPGQASETWVRAEGRFTINQLVAGSYTLRLQHSAPRSGRHDFPPVAAGTAGLELVLPLGEIATVAFEVDAGGASVKRTIFLSAHDLHRTDAAAPGGEAPAEAEFSAPSGWPAGTMLGFQGASGRPQTHGYTSDNYVAVDGTRHVSPPLQPGWYEFGVQAFGEDGAAFFPAGTGTLFLGPGEHRFRFTVVPATEIELRLSLGDRDSGLRVALADVAGGLVPLQGTGPLESSLELRADGGLRLPLVPVGPLELRVGTAEELRAGGARYRRRIEIPAQPDGPLEIRLP